MDGLINANRLPEAATALAAQITDPQQRAATLPRLDFIPFRGAVRLSGKCDHEFYLLVSDVPLNAEPNGLPPGAVPRRTAARSAAPHRIRWRT